jgi:hypothetical protein
MCAQLAADAAPLQVFVQLVPPPQQVPRGMCVQPAAAHVLGGEGALSHVFMNTPLALEVWATRDCFVYLVEQDAHGKLCPLLPVNAVQTGADCRLRAHERRRVPDAARGDAFKLAFVPPAGLERVFAFASLTPWDAWSADADRLQSNVRSLSRGMAVTAAAPTQPHTQQQLAMCCHTFNLIDN